MSDKAGPEATPIRDAATVIVTRPGPAGPEVLMGQRGAQASFMPSKVVFPGGAVDPGDATIPLAAPLPAPCQTRLVAEAGPRLAHALSAAAIRELWEETGLPLGLRGTWAAPPPEDWRGFADFGYRPSAAGLRYVFRAITPKFRPRRFDARFFLLDAATLDTDLEDFSRACEELSHLQWIPIRAARDFNLPFITEVVLAEVAALLARGGQPDHVPFFDNSGRPEFRALP